MPTIKIRLKELMHDKAVRDGRNPEYQPLTQEEVADAVGISRGAMSDWCREKVNRLDKDIMAKLCEYFGCGIEELLLLEGVSEVKSVS